MIQTADISILLPWNYTILLLRLLTPQRQPRKPMTIWLSPNRSSRIPTSSRPKNTEKWITLYLFSLESKCKVCFLQSPAVMPLVVGSVTSVGDTQASLKNHCRLKDSGWMSLKWKKRYKIFRNITYHEKAASLCPEKGKSTRTASTLKYCNQKL